MAASRTKVMLITPPYHSGVVESAGVWLPLGLVYLAGEARRAGAEVRLYDAMSLQDTHEDIAREIEAFAPDIVAVSAFTALEPDAREVCRSAKRLRPEALTVMGGVHPTFMWDEVLRGEPAVDVVVRGEGEATFGDVVRAVAGGAPLDGVPGLAFRRNGVPVETGPRPFVPDLDVLSPAWDLVDWPRYFYRPSPEGRLAIVSSSRGCTHQCSFCSQQLFWRRSWRGRSPEAFVSELEFLRDRFDVRVVMLSDETPTVDPERWESILDLLVERRVGTEILMETRVDHIIRDKALMPKYRAAGVSHIYVGAESTSQSTLDVFQKDIRIEQSKHAIKLINDQDIVSETSFVLGMPGETPASIRETVDLARHYAPDLAFFLAIAPWPYGGLYQELKPFIEVRDYRKYNLVEPVVRPVNMTLKELSDELVLAAQTFYVDKMKHLDEITEHKQDFLKRVMKIMMDYSYLGEHMRAIKGQLPEKVRKFLEQVPGRGPAGGSR